MRLRGDHAAMTASRNIDRCLKRSRRECEDVGADGFGFVEAKQSHPDRRKHRLYMTENNGFSWILRKRKSTSANHKLRSSNRAPAEEMLVDKAQHFLGRCAV